MDTHAKLLEMLREFDTAMFVTHANDSQLAARPMAIARVEDSGAMWFISDRSSGKMDDLQSDHCVAITLQSSNQYVSLSGKVNISMDRSKVKELWREGWKVWFPDGPDDSSICLLHVVPVFAEYWDNKGNEGLKYILKAGTAYLKGERPKIEENMNATVSMPA